jgi:hypothetical protein
VAVASLEGFKDGSLNLAGLCLPGTKSQLAVTVIVSAWYREIEMIRTEWRHQCSTELFYRETFCDIL